jgi:hypothetical protein
MIQLPQAIPDADMLLELATEELAAKMLFLVDDARIGTTLAFQPLASMGRLVVGHFDKGFCFGIKDGIKTAGRNGKILVWQRIIAGFDPSRPSQAVTQLEIVGPRIR